MSETTERKSRWDAPAPGNAGGDAAPVPAPAGGESKPSAADNEAAQKAAAIAAKIAASLRPPGSSGFEVARRAGAPEGDFVKDIEINDLRNRYVLTRSSTQKNDETGASIETKGVWVPDRSRMPPGEMPLYLHIVAKSQVILDAAVAKVNELIDQELGPLIEERTLIARARATGQPLPPGVGQRQKWPEEKLFIGLDPIRNFNIRAKVVGPGGMFVKYIQAETGARVQIKGRGSGFIENDTGRESDEAMHISIVAPTDEQIQRAKILADDLLMVLRIEYDKARGVYPASGAGYDSYGGAAVQGAHGYDTAAAAQQANQDASTAPYYPPAEGPGTEQWEAYAAYWRAYGYDVNDPQFQEWQRGQMAAAGQQAAA
ncbi:hypothetical protein A1Q2_01023 [Trichosporon asahii var. asahii CBS 8904]|uniref:Uncharacterized protein n=1 Tax=Trichosporon asahii var. asahii (strain CBS 8904) TaxID=1220162 RepID=K1VKL1_TRIAC|nr:hypothetical protein A1Q2_01023 [Trichosporon asahii var. asahii CBS 8904]